MKKRVLFALVGAVALAACPLSAQSQELEKMANDYRAASKKSREQARELAKSGGWPVKGKTSHGKVFELQGLQSGFPFYYATSNLESAKTTRTDSAQVYIGGGAGFTIGLWDAGAPRFTHQELFSRVTWGDPATAVFDDHSTHVAGTMIGAGVRPEAKGMAYEAKIKAYEWNDDLAEMTNEAAHGLLVSSHSYGPIRGWFESNDWYWFGDSTVSETTDYRFGFYDDIARDLDELQSAAPNYLVVTAAGNDRNDAVAPGTRHLYFDFRYNSWRWSMKVRDNDGAPFGYDCIPNGFSIAKNSLAIGAVEPCLDYTGPADVLMTPYSSWGPTDDGRIKPDLVGDGWNVYSSVATSDTSYDYYYGTSMASPNVCGSLALLQKYYRGTHRGFPMRAATLRALAIHTAGEAGDAPGPDYAFGWGLLDTYAAYREILADVVGKKGLIEELTLNEGTPLELSYLCSGTAPELRVTICWTDPPGTPPAPALNPPQPMLVNDLDLRVLKDGTTFEPWVLDPAHPMNPAAKGDNVRDNVEQVVIPTPEAGLYVIRIDHKGSLRGSAQNFSLIVTAAERAKTWNVYSDGSGDAPSIAAAVDSAAGGDMILLYPGVFAEHDIVVDKPVVIKGVMGPAFTYIDAKNLGRCFVLASEAGAARLEDLTLTRGRAEGSGLLGRGGAILCGSDATIVGCTITKSRAMRGGGIFIDGAAATVRNCRIDANSSGEAGGGMYLLACDALIDHSVIVQNGSSADGGGIYCAAGIPVLSNCTVSHNFAIGRGGAVYVGTEGAPTLERCIVSFSTLGEGIFGRVGALGAALSCCDVFGNVGGDYGGSIPEQTGENGNISADPQFCDPAAVDFGIGDGSPCRPDGNSCGALIGARPVGCHSRTLWRVNADGTGDAPTIQAAIDRAFDGDTILVAAGTYTGDGNRDISVEGKALLITSAAGPEATIVDCESSPMSFHGGFNFITAEDSTSVLEGLTVKRASDVGVRCTGASPIIRNCRFVENVFFTAAGGGGVHLESSSARVSRCVISHNRSTSLGAGVYLKGGSPRIDHCVISGNFSQKSGGAISIQSGTYADIRSCTMSADTAMENGGGIFVSAATVHVDSCVVSGSRGVFGGGIYNGVNGTCTVTNSTVYGNSASSGGGGTYSGTNMTIRNCTIAGNRAGFYGGGVENTYGDRNPISRSIIASNTNGSGIYTIVTAQTISCSDVYGNAGGNYGGNTTDQTGKNNNISADPSFCDATGGDYRIYDTSPCSPAQSSCGALVGALDVGCRIAPNLVIARVEFSKVFPAAHESVIATLTVKNTGVASADSVIIDFYKNRQSAPGASQTGDERFRAGALAVGDSIVWATSPFTSDTIGSWRSWFALDADRRVVETNENDNVSGPHAIGWRIPNEQGWPIAMGSSSDSSPLLVNLDSDPTTLDVVLGCGGNLCVWGSHGEALPGWPANLGSGIIPSPAAGDITGDSRKEIVVCTEDNKLHAFDGSGNELWQVLVAQYGGTQAPVLADLDGDGKLEILVAHWDGTYLYEGDGSPFANPKIIFGHDGVRAPSIGDIDDDGNPEIVSVGPNAFGRPTSSVLVTRADGEAYFHWPHDADTVIVAEPVIGDITSDHKHMEIVALERDGYVQAWSYDGSQCFTHGKVRVPGMVWSAPALADVNRDGYEEIIVTSTMIGDVHHQAYVTVIGGDGVVLSSKTIADWYGIGHVIDAPLVIIGRPAHAIVATADSTIQSDGYGFPLSLPGLMMAGPAAGDIDGDGWVELVAASSDSLYCFELCSPAYPVNALWWPLARRNAERTACYGYEPAAGVDDGGKKQTPAATTFVGVYPNPFNPTTKIRFDLSARSRVEIAIFDIAGRRVAVLVDRDMEAGSFEAVWDGRTSSGGRAASGVYFCRLKAGSLTEARKIVLVR